MSKYIIFLIFRQNTGTIQGVLSEGETVSQNMLLWAETIHHESVVWVEGTFHSQRRIGVQLTGSQLYLVSSPSAALPFWVEDVSLPIGDLEELPGVFGQRGIYRSGGANFLHSMAIRLTPVTEIQSSKFQPSASESGAAVFGVDHFRRPAYLTQVWILSLPPVAQTLTFTPRVPNQLNRCAPRVIWGRCMESGLPAFRAEKSNTHRYLEMEIDNHYHEVMNSLDQLSCTYSACSTKTSETRWCASISDAGHGQSTETPVDRAVER